MDDCEEELRLAQQYGVVAQVEKWDVGRVAKYLANALNSTRENRPNLVLRKAILDVGALFQTLGIRPNSQFMYLVGLRTRLLSVALAQELVRRQMKNENTHGRKVRELIVEEGKRDELLKDLGERVAMLPSFAGEYASLDEINVILAVLPEPASTAFAVAAYMGLRHGEIQGLLWENYRDGEMFVSRSIWNGRISEPKTRKGRAPVPVIRQLAERLEMHRLRCGNPQTGPIFANALGKPLALGSLVNRVILPALNRCEVCRKREVDHQKADHAFKRDESIPTWRGWHAARRGLESNLYRLGVPDIVIQRILRHANVSTTATYYIKTAADDVRDAMTKLENRIAESAQTLKDTHRTLNSEQAPVPSRIQ